MCLCAVLTYYTCPFTTVLQSAYSIITWLKYYVLVTCTSMWKKCQRPFIGIWWRDAKEVLPLLYRYVRLIKQFTYLQYINQFFGHFLCIICVIQTLHTLCQSNFMAEALLDSFGYHYYPNQPATECSSRIFEYVFIQSAMHTRVLIRSPTVRWWQVAGIIIGKGLLLNKQIYILLLCTQHFMGWTINYGNLWHGFLVNSQ